MITITHWHVRTWDEGKVELDGELCLLQKSMLTGRPCTGKRCCLEPAYADPEGTILIQS